MKKIQSVAFVYLTQESGDYYVTDDPGYTVQKRPQLGLQYLCGVLERKGIRTNIFDQTAQFFNLNHLIGRIKKYDLLGFYCSDPQEEKVKKYCQEIKKELGIPIVVGGPSTLNNTSFLDRGCDIVVHGEGEMTIQEIVNFYNGEIKLEDIAGISYKLNNTNITNPPREMIRNLDEIPFPDRSKIPVNEYYDWFLFGMKKPYVTMIASRGCINRCTFCTSCKIWGYKYRQRSVDNVLEEIDDVVKKYNAKYIAFQDDIFGITITWIEEFCRKLMERPYKIKWMAIFHPLSLRKDTERVLRLMKRSGCDTLSFGLQSAHPQVLKNIRRLPSEPEQLRKTLKIAYELGFITYVTYIFGLPGDTRETIQTTIDYSLKSGATLSAYFILSVLRGSGIDLKLRGNKFCELNGNEIELLTAYASRKFYTDIKVILRISYFVLIHPGWFVNVLFKLPSILARIGFIKIRNRKQNGINPTFTAGAKIAS